jgi:hypothetical protein
MQEFMWKPLDSLYIDEYTVDNLELYRAASFAYLVLPD